MLKCEFIGHRDSCNIEEIICPFGEKEYLKYDIPNRNKWIVDNCNILLCYVHKEGVAKNTLNYAILKNKKVINILL